MLIFFKILVFVILFFYLLKLRKSIIARFSLQGIRTIILSAIIFGLILGGAVYILYPEIWHR